MFQPFDALMFARHGFGLIKMLQKPFAQNFYQERAFATAADSGNTDEFAQRDADV